MQRDLLSGKTGFFDYSDNGILTFMSFLPIPKTNWFLVQSVPASVMPRYASIVNLRRALMVMILLLFLALLSILALLRWNRRITTDSRNTQLLNTDTNQEASSLACGASINSTKSVPSFYRFSIALTEFRTILERFENWYIGKIVNG